MKKVEAISGHSVSRENFLREAEIVLVPCGLDVANFDGALLDGDSFGIRSRRIQRFSLR